MFNSFPRATPLPHVLDMWKRIELLDEEQERLTQRRQWLKEKRNILDGAIYHLSCGAIEKVTQRWEKS